MNVVWPLPLFDEISYKVDVWDINESMIRYWKQDVIIEYFFTVGFFYFTFLDVSLIKELKKYI